MKRSISFMFVFFLVLKVAYSQWDRGGSLGYDDDEESMTLRDVGFTLAGGAVLAVVGYLLMQIKSISGLGKFLVGFGAILGVGNLILYLLQILSIVLTATISIAFKVAVVIGAIVLAIWILKGIYEWIMK